MTDAPAKRPPRRESEPKLASENRKPTVTAGGVPLASAVELWPLDRLAPYPDNPRLHNPEQVRELVLSILEFGFTNPILVDGAGGVIAGHGRLAAARRLALERVPVIVLGHLTETQRRAYLLADNQLALNASWDPARLGRELQKLESEAFDLRVTGFSPDQVRELYAELERAAAPATTTRRGRPPGQILVMLQFDNVEQRDRWHSFQAWVRERGAAGQSPAAALLEHVERSMERARGAVS